MEIHKNLVFVSYLTITPVNTNVHEFVDEFQEKICGKENHELLLFGQRTKEIDQSKVAENVKVHSSITEFINLL